LKTITITPFLLLIISCFNEYNELKVSPLFSNGAVLQRNTQVSIWGEAVPNSNIKIFSEWGQELKIKSNTDGSWIGKLSTPDAGGPFYLKINSAKETLIIRDLLIGEVWLASGQSNMEMTLTGYPPNDTILNYRYEIKNANYSKIRMFNVEKHFSNEPRKELKGAWLDASPSNVKQFSSTAYFFAREIHTNLDVPVGIIHSSWGGSPCEAWVSENKLTEIGFFQEIPERFKNSTPKSTNDRWFKYFSSPTVLFNGMIYPIIPFTIKGAIWYQGESNVGRHDQYIELFPGMIEDWRKRWGETFPFYFVQIAPFKYNADPKMNISQKLRDSQRKSQKVPKTGMVVTLDIGDYTNIHPANKQEVGKRLARLALVNNYNSDLNPLGPILINSSIVNGGVRLDFSNVGSGLVLKMNKGNEFEIANNMMEFVEAEVSVDMNYLLLSSQKIKNPRYVRYAWSDTPEATLFNGDGFPASSLMLEIK